MDSTPIQAKSIRHLPFSNLKIPHVPKKYIIFGIIGIVLFVGLIWYVSPYVQKFFAGLNPPIEASLIPEKEEVQVDEEFQVSMRLTSREASALELYLSYDSSIFAYATEYGQTTGFSQVTQDYFLSPLVEEVIPSSEGSIKKLHILLVSHEGQLDAIQFNLKFKALKEGASDFITASETKVAGSSDDDTATYFDLPENVATNVRVVGSGTDPGTCACTGETVSSDTCSVGYGPVCSLVDADNSCACQALDPTLTPTNTPAPENSITPEEGTPTPTTEPTTESPTPIPTDVPDTESPTPIPTEVSNGGSRGDVDLKLKVRFQGLTVQPAEEYRTMNAKVVLAAEDKSFREEKSVRFDVDGNGQWTGTYSAKNVPLGAQYAVFIKGSKHLMKKICETSPTESVAGTYKCSTGKINLKEGSQEMDLNKIILLVGDLPQQDGIIDSLDLAFVRNNFGSKTNSTVARGDLNLDGIVDTQDMVLMLKALEFKYDED